jgi:Holliday junction resolvase YEN1
MKFKQSFGFGPRISTSSGAFEGRVRPFDLTSCFPNLVLLLVRCPVWASLGISHPYRSLYQFSNDTISLWDILGEGEVKSLAQISTDHWKIHKRPLRVAIDEAGWRFHNLSDAQVAAIRQKVPEANPIEKAIFWRVLKLMRMNIQPIFIFDGPSRPWKRGGVAGRIDWKKIDSMRKMLTMLRIPHHRAPAEAEAECARLNELGIVDAVWTDDGDAFMFGAKVLIKEHREGRGNAGKKSDNLIRVYRAEDIERKHRINRQGLVLFALLSGGDYDTKGLPDCGPTTALSAAQFDHGRLGKILCETPLRQLHCFTESLRDYFKMPGTKGVYVPPGYPRDLHVKNYREPKVSTPEKAHNLRGLKDGWYIPIDEDKLRPFLLAMFNVDTKAYLKHIVPLLLLKELVHTTPETVTKNLVFDIQLAHKRGKDPNAEYLERPITFNPKKCTDLPLWTKPDNEDWKEDFDPTAPVETEFLEYVLVGALGEAEMERLKRVAGQPKPRKRKTTDVAAEGIGSQATAETVVDPPVPAAKKQRKAPPSQANVESSTSTSKSTSKPAAKSKAPKKNGKTAQTVEEPKPAEPEVPALAVKKGFQLPRALVRNPSMLSELASQSQSSQDVLSRSTSFQSVDLTSESSRKPSASTSALAPRSFDNSIHFLRENEVMVVMPGREQQSRSSPKRTHTKPPAGSQARQDVPPSSQLNPAAQSWSFSRLEDTTAHEDIPVSRVPSASKPSAQAVQQARPPIFGEETPSPEPMPAPPSSFVPPELAARLPPSQPSVSRRGYVVLDLDSDDEEFPSSPALCASAPPTIPRPTSARPPTAARVARSCAETVLAPSIPPVQAPPTETCLAPNSHVPTSPAPSMPTPSKPTPSIPGAIPPTATPPAKDSREAIAAARLKHFEKKVHETIDLTLDD